MSYLLHSKPISKLKIFSCLTFSLYVSLSLSPPPLLHLHRLPAGKKKKPNTNNRGLWVLCLYFFFFFFSGLWVLCFCFFSGLTLFLSLSLSTFLFCIMLGTLFVLIAWQTKWDKENWSRWWKGRVQTMESKGFAKGKATSLCSLLWLFFKKGFIIGNYWKTKHIKFLWRFVKLLFWICSVRKRCNLFCLAMVLNSQVKEVLLC